MRGLLPTIAADMTTFAPENTFAALMGQSLDNSYVLQPCPQSNTSSTNNSNANSNNNTMETFVVSALSEQGQQSDASTTGLIGSFWTWVTAWLEYLTKMIQANPMIVELAASILLGIVFLIIAIQFGHQ
jgi:hypothetical protein